MTPTLMGIVEDSEGICRRLDAGQAPVPTITPMPTEILEDSMPPQ